MQATCLSSAAEDLDSSSLWVLPPNQAAYQDYFPKQRYILP